MLSSFGKRGKREPEQDGDGDGDGSGMMSYQAWATVVGLSSHWTGFVNDY